MIIDETAVPNPSAQPETYFESLVSLLSNEFFNFDIPILDASVRQSFLQFFVKIEITIYGMYCRL